MRFTCIACMKEFSLDILNTTTVDVEGHISCPSCGNSILSVRVDFRCNECGNENFFPIDGSIEKCKYFQCPKCGSPNLSYF